MTGMTLARKRRWPPRVKHHLGHTASSHDALRAAALSIGAAVWARLEVPYGAWPWRLFTSGEQAGRARCDLEVCRQFLAERVCCLDDPFGQWFRRLAATERDFGKPATQTLLGQLRRQGARSMPLEGLSGADQGLYAMFGEKCGPAGRTHGVHGATAA